MKEPRWLNVLVWTASVLMAALFTAASLPKLTGAQQMVDHFAHWGFPDWFRIVVGVLELGCSVGLLVPRVAAIAASGIVVLMLGATYTHAVLAPEEVGRVGFTLTLVVVAAGVAYARWSRLGLQVPHLFQKEA